MKKKLILALLMACFAIVACDKEEDNGEISGENNLADITTTCIKEIFPQKGENKIDIFSSINMQLNFSCNETECYSRRQYKYFCKTNIDYLEVENITKNEKVKGEYSISEDGFTVTFVPEKTLEPNSEYKIKVKVSILKKNGEEWVLAQNLKNSLLTEEKESTFTTTDNVPNSILPNHILYAYPIDRMYNFYSKETNTGYVCLSENYGFLFEQIPEGYTRKLRLSTKDGNYQDIDFTYFKSKEIENQKYEINFDLSKLNFENNKIYKLQILQIPTNGNTSDTIQIYSIDFRTSKYNTFKEKIDNIVLDGKAIFAGRHKSVYETYDKDNGHNINIKSIQLKFESDDFFDTYEMQEFGKKDNLVYLRADLENTEWYKNSIYYVLYHNFKKSDVLNFYDFDALHDRFYSFPPADAMTIYNPMSIKHDKLTDYEIETDNPTGINNSGMIIYSLEYYFILDVEGICNYVRQKYSRNETLEDYEKEFLDVNHPLYHEDFEIDEEYPYFISYRLPGKNIVTSEFRKVLIGVDEIY